MKLKIHLCDKVEESLFDNFHNELNKVFPFGFEVFLEDKFSLDAKSSKELLSCSEDDNIFEYDSISIFDQNFFNLTKITQKYPKDDSLRVFYLTTPFYHESIQPMPIVPIEVFTKKINDNYHLCYSMNGTADFSKNHILIGGTSFETNENYFPIFHELFHLLHDKKIDSCYKNGIQVAHCNNFILGERCIMNPPEKVFYSPSYDDRDRVGSRFCKTCLKKLSNI